MKQYKEMINEVLSSNIERDNDRTGIGRISAFGITKTYSNIKKEFPLLTLKKTNFDFIKDELLWFISGSNDINKLQEKTKMIWKDWSDINGSIGYTYGYQFGKKSLHKIQDELFSIDQIEILEKEIVNNPQSTRLIINLWNVQDLFYMNLPPCLFNYQFLIDDKNTISLVISQRSGDLMLGIPFNIASASLLLMLIAKTYDLKVGKLVHNIGDLHIYKNHLYIIDEILNNPEHPFPIVEINKRNSLKEYTLDDIILKNYQSNKYYKLPIAV